jgi:hypothetical protein
MPIEPPEIPPPTPGQPGEPPREDPPGNPNPEIPPPVHEPGAPPQPQELPGQMPDEVPGHGTAQSGDAEPRDRSRGGQCELTVGTNA